AQITVSSTPNPERRGAGFRQAGSQSETFGSKVKGLGKAAVVAGGAAGLAALTGTLKVGIDEMTEASKVSAQTAAAIKSTGGAAGISAAGVAKLAGSLMKKSGVEDEAIQSGENLLLTFTKVQNKVGKGNDIFNRATKTMLDMSVALGQDTKTSAIQLGKALNNPIKGVTALQRVGVSFTDSQKAQIKALQESGDTMGAQKIILAELSKEFGGSAEAAGKTLAGQINVLKESFSNLAGELISTLVPALTTITTFFVKNPALAKAMVFGILAISAAMVTLNVALAISAAIGSPFIGIILGITAAVALLVAGAVILYKNWDTVTAVLEAGFARIKAAAADVFGWLQSNWPLILGILTGPVGAAVAVIITHWSTIKSVTNAAWSAIKSATASAWNAVQPAVATAVGAVWSVVSSTWNAVKSATTTAW